METLIDEMEEETMPLFGSVPMKDEIVVQHPKQAHKEATVICYTTLLMDGMELNVTLRQGVMPDDIDSVLDAALYLQSRVLEKKGLFVIKQQPMFIETDEQKVMVGLRTVPKLYDNSGNGNSGKLAEPAQPKSNYPDPTPDGPFAPGQGAAPQPQQTAPKQGSNLVTFEVDHIIWASMMPSKKYPGQFTTTFRVYDTKGFYNQYGVVCYPEALQKSGFDIGGATAGWTLNLAGQGWFAHCFPSKELNKYGEYWPDKVAYFAQAQQAPQAQQTQQEKPF